MTILASTAPSVPVQVVNLIDILFSWRLNDEDVATRASKEVSVIWKNILQEVLNMGLIYGCCMEARFMSERESGILHQSKV